MEEEIRRFGQPPVVELPHGNVSHIDPGWCVRASMPRLIPVRCSLRGTCRDASGLFVILGGLPAIQVRGSLRRRGGLSREEWGKV